jgi:peptide/nickel transport system permease protein
VGLLLVGAFVLAGLTGPFLNANILGHTCFEMPKPEFAPAPPSREHWLGTDDQGRDLLARLLCGSRTSLFIGVTAEAIALFLGVLLGGLAGYAGGRTDTLIMRFTDIVLAFPFPLVAIAVVALTRAGGAWTILLLLGILGWPGIARLVRARLLAVRESEFVAAARASGAGDARVLLRHALPAGMTPVWAAAAVGIAGNILAEAWLSFIGLGDQTRTSWGTILQNARNFASSSWWYPLFPGLAITLAILGFILLGEALREALDPHDTTETR